MSKTHKRTPLIAGNWKMNFDHLQAIAFVQKLGWSLSEAKHDVREAEVAVFPPFTDLRSVQTLLQADKLELSLGAQDLSVHDAGAYTGEISGAFLQKLDVQYVIVGHSERRANHGEDDVAVTQKALAALRHGLTPVICVGESESQRETEELGRAPVAQLQAVLSQLPEEADFVVAYEPVWAIGTGKAAEPADAQQISHLLRAAISQTLGPAAAERTRILYGGSVKSSNVAQLMRQHDIDGALVGGASLLSDEFLKIIRFNKHVTI